MSIPWEGIGTALGVAALVILKSFYNGKLNEYIVQSISDWLSERKRSKALGDHAHGEITDRLEDIHQTVHQTDDKVDDLAEAFVVVNRQRDDVDVSALRDRLGVDDLDADLVHPND